MFLKIKTLAGLFELAKSNIKYEYLLRMASVNLGGPKEDSALDEHENWLRTAALETSEEGVVEEVNSLIPFVLRKYDG